MLTSSHSSSLPPPSRIESTCKRLLEDGEYCLLVGLVEKWGETQDPTIDARLVQAEAMLELKLMDKAWVRLKAMVDSGAGGVRPHLLSARMFIERGWPAKARKVLNEGLERHPGHAGINALLEQASKERHEVDAGRADAEDVTNEELVTLAEHFMVQGAFVRARVLLERVRRSDEPNPRSAQLLCALDGQFDLEESITDVVGRYGSAFIALELADIGDDQDHTESASLSDLPLQIDRDDEDRFPSLFRSLDAGPPVETTSDLTPDAEVTAVTSMAEMQNMLKASAPSATSNISDDTQIMRVVHRGGMEPVAPGAAHMNTPEPDASFNLADFQREMGMVPRPMSSDMDFVGPEDEDESVVVVTRQDDAEPEMEAPERPRLTLDTATDAIAAEALGPNVDEVWRDPNEGPTAQLDRKELVASEPPSPERAESSPKEEPTSEPSDDPFAGFEDIEAGQIPVWPWWLAVLVLGMALSALLFAAFVLVIMLG